MSQGSTTTSPDRESTGLATESHKSHPGSETEFRLDRAVSLYLMHPLLRLVSARETSVPILMYHSIAEEDESAVGAYYRTATHPRVFAAHMGVLHNAGYSVISLGEAAQRLADRSQNTRGSLVITFDDGYRNIYTDAFPILEHYGFTASVFLPTAHIGEGNLEFKGKRCLSWDEVRELQRHGISFGSHTVNHPQLHDLNAVEIREEVTVSKHAIEQRLGCAAESFAYPYAFPETDGEFKAMLGSLLDEAGYRYGVCTSLGRPRPGDDPLFLKRLPVNSCDDESLFRAKLAGAYDWLAGPQRLVKWAKSLGQQRSCEAC